MMDATKIKLTEKQKAVVLAMREGMRLYKLNGFNSKVCTSQNFVKVSFPTLWKMKELGLLEISKQDFRSVDYRLSELARTIEI